MRLNHDPYQRTFHARVGFGEIIATPCQRDAKAIIDLMLDNAYRLDADVDRLAKEGKIQGPNLKKGIPLPKDSLWYRWKICFEQSTSYHSRITSEGGEGINSANCDEVRQVSQSLLDRHESFRKELSAVAPGQVDPGKVPPPPPPPVIEGKDILGGLGTASTGLVAIAAVAFAFSMLRSHR